MKLFSGLYSKFFAAAVVAADTGLEAFFPSAPWVPAVVGGLGAVLVFLVPNVAAAAPPAAPPAAG